MDTLIDSSNLTGFIFFLITANCAVIQISYFLIAFTGPAFYKSKKNKNIMHPVSVIISARNEIENLKKNLLLFLEQDYPDYQVVVVNDCSWDDSELFLNEMSQKYPHLKVVTLLEQERYLHGKKFALTMGIKASKYDCLLFSDADCRPAGKDWIRLMQSHFSQKTNIVLGYGAYEKRQGLLNKLIRFDTFFNAMQFLSYSLAGLPYMGVGRNLAYSKSMFFKNKGFARHQHVISGDDDLFVNETANASNTIIEIEPGAFTISDPEKTMPAWFRQKRRHLTTASHYRAKHKFFLGLFSLTQFCFYAGIVFLLIYRFDYRIVVIMYASRLSVQTIIYGKNMSKLKEFDLLWLLPVYDFFIILFYVTLAISNLVSKPSKWK